MTDNRYNVVREKRKSLNYYIYTRTNAPYITRVYIYVRDMCNTEGTNKKKIKREQKHEIFIYILYTRRKIVLILFPLSLNGARTASNNAFLIIL